MSPESELSPLPPRFFSLPASFIFPIIERFALIGIHQQYHLLRLRPHFPSLPPPHPLPLSLPKIQTLRRRIPRRTPTALGNATATTLRHPGNGRRVEKPHHTKDISIQYLVWWWRWWEEGERERQGKIDALGKSDDAEIGRDERRVAVKASYRDGGGDVSGAEWEIFVRTRGCWVLCRGSRIGHFRGWRCGVLWCGVV